MFTLRISLLEENCSFCGEKLKLWIGLRQFPRLSVVSLPRVLIGTTNIPDIL